MSERDSNRADISPVADGSDQRHPRAILETGPSFISFESTRTPPGTIGVLDDIYTFRHHRQCVDRSYLTLLSMVMGVAFWISYWLTWNRCENSHSHQANEFLCDLVVIFEILTYVSIGISPFLFTLMTYSWVCYSCWNPFDEIRHSCIEIKLEGNTWQRQLDEFYRSEKSKYRKGLCCCRCRRRRRQRRELTDRAYGHVVLSPRGLAIDELQLHSARNNLFDRAVLIPNQRTLTLHLKATCQRPWKKEVLIHLPEEFINRSQMEKLSALLQIEIQTETTLPPCS